MLFNEANTEKPDGITFLFIMRPRLFSIALVITLLYGGLASAFANGCLHARRAAADASVSAAEMPDCCVQDAESGAAHCPMQNGEEPSARDSAAVSDTGECSFDTGESMHAHDARQAIHVAHLSTNGSGNFNALAQTCQSCVSRSERTPASAQSGNVSISKRGDAILLTRAVKHPDLSAHTIFRHAATTQGDPPGAARRYVLHSVFLI
ncbi:MAG: hypothetical protein WCD76_08675 [Pyrinomonadaceae bacterium]